MTFERPDLATLAPWAALVLLLLVVLQWRRGVRLVEAWGGRAAALRLLGRDLRRPPVLRGLALALAGAALALSAAGPERAEPEPLPPPVPLDLMVAVDVSLSMTADDVEGTRIGRARTTVEEIVDGAVADRMSLSLFADWPYGLVPLTDDGTVISFFAPWITPALVGTRDQGTSLPAVLGHLRDVWDTRPREDSRRIVLLVTDGEAHGGEAELLDSVASLASDGMEVWVAGVGTESGAPIYLPGSDGAPLLFDGAPVVAVYDPGLLEAAAEEGRGRFHDISTDGGLDALVDELRGGGESGAPAGDTPARTPAFWLLLAALALLLLDAILDAGVLARRRDGRAAGPFPGGSGKKASSSRIASAPTSGSRRAA